MAHQHEQQEAGVMMRHPSIIPEDDSYDMYDGGVNNCDACPDDDVKADKIWSRFANFFLYGRLRGKDVDGEDVGSFMRWLVMVLWKVSFAIVAVMDMMPCWHVISVIIVSSGIGNGAEGGGGELAICPATFPSNNASNNFSSSTTLWRQSTCTAINYVQSVAVSSRIHSQHIHVVFCIMCLVEMVIRAREARQIAIENDAIAKFEATIQKAYSRTRMYATQSFFWNNNTDPSSLSSSTNIPDEDVYKLPTESLRLWIPVGVTCFFWFALLPSDLSDYRWSYVDTQAARAVCGPDSAILNLWISTSLVNVLRNISDLKNQVVEVIWEEILMPYNFISQPRRFWKRVRVILRAIKLVRFAFPLARMSLKVGDQLYALLNTWRQTHTVQVEREKRIRRPSLLLHDLQRVESMAKGLTGLASLPSRFFDFAVGQDGEDEPTPTNSQRHLKAKRESGQYIKKQLKKLKREMSRTISHFSAADLYDKVQKVRDTVIAVTSKTSSQQNNSMISKFLSSRDLLMSPRSRFSVVWRMTVTNCLLLELARLSISWNLTKTFNLSITQIVSRLMVHCDRPKATQNHFRFITDRVDHIHKALANAIPLIPRPQEKWILCAPTSFSSRTFLFLGYWMESFIDVVSFVDIFVWFFTGDLDDRGTVIPKTFLYRCIIPGTLTQFLDHPTLPWLLPSLLHKLRMIAEAVGWGRASRWVFAICPALAVTIIYPMTTYFFSHIDDFSNDSKDDLLMAYAESFGYLPERPVSRNFSSIGLDYDTDDWSPIKMPKRKLPPMSTPSPGPVMMTSALLHRSRVPSMARSTPSTLSSDSPRMTPMTGQNAGDSFADSEDMYDDSQLLSRGFNSSVRFDHHVTIMERLDSIQSSDHQSWEDDSSFDVGLNLSTRDLQSLHQD